MKYFAKSLRKNFLLCFFAGWILFILVGFVVNANAYKLLWSDMIIEKSTIYEDADPSNIINETSFRGNGKRRSLSCV